MNHPSRQFEIEIEGRRETLDRVGPGAEGVIYRSGAAWYRVYTAEMPLAQVHAIRSQIGRAQPGCAPITSCFAQRETGWYITQYKARGAKHTLHEVQTSGDVPAGLNGVAAVLRSLPRWWNTLGAPLLPTPADMLLTETGEALLMPASRWRVPTIEELFAEPERAVFLAPELFRYAPPEDERQRRALDRFAMGATLLRCFFRNDAPNHACEAITRAAIGAACRWRTLRDSLPFWIEQVRVTENVIAMGRLLASPLVSERSESDLGDLAKWLSTCSHKMDPLAAFREAAEESEYNALQLFENLLLENETYELLVEGADLEWLVNSELKAMMLYERAIKLDPHKPDAYRRQFEVIAFTRQNPSLPLAAEYANNLDFAMYLDVCIRRDFDCLERLAPKQAFEREMKMAMHYLWRGAKLSTFFESAKQFVRERVYDSRKKFLAWKLELRLVYSEALIEQAIREKEPTAREELLDQATDIRDRVQADIGIYETRPQMDQLAVRRAREYSRKLAVRLAQLRPPKSTSSDPVPSS